MADEASPFEKQQEQIVLGRPVVGAPVLAAIGGGGGGDGTASSLRRSSGHVSNSSNSNRSGTRTALLAVRVLQVILSAVLSALAGMAIAAGVWMRIEATKPGSPLHDLIDADSQVDAQAMMQDVAVIVLAVAVALLVVSITTLALSLAWLVLTCAPSRRGSGRVSRYSCDLGFDIGLAVLWAALFALQMLAAIRSSTEAPVMSIALYAAQAALFVASAVLSARMRRQVLRNSRCRGGSSFIAA